MIELMKGLKKRHNLRITVVGNEGREPTPIVYVNFS